MGEPVPEGRLATSLDVPPERLPPRLASLQAIELVAVSDGGYRPTVTAYELLELDVDPADVLVVDIVDE